MDNKATGGIGVLSVVGIVFLILKLAGIVDWCWAIVLLPFWGPLSLVGTVLICVAIGAVVSWAVNANKKK